MTKIQIRRDTAANWTSANPVLSSGELGLETDTRKWKIGTGALSWTSLTYMPLGTVTSVAGQTSVVTLTKSDVGLSNVDNTSDANKPVSTAATTALALKAPLASPTFTGTVAGVTKSHVGLSNVDNTADVNKVVSTLQQAAIDAGVAGKFGFEVQLPYELSAGEVIAGGVPFIYNETVDKVIASVDLEPRGADLAIAVVKRARVDGNESLLGTMTITNSVSRRGSLTGLNAAILAGDRLYFRITTVGSSQAGADLNIRLGGTSMAIPTALAAPTAVPTFTAVPSGADIVLTSSAPATGVYSGTDIYKDGGWLARLPKGTTTYTDSAAAADAHTYRANAFNNDAVASGTTASYIPSSGLTSPVFIGSTGQTTTNQTAIPITVTAAVPVGDHVIVHGCTLSNVNTYTGVDSRGNTYTVQSQAAVPTTGTVDVVSLRSKLTTALQVGDTITITNSTNRDRYAFAAWSVHGLTATTPLDKSQTNADESSQKISWTSGTTAALASANEVAFGGLGFNVAQDPANINVASGWNVQHVAATSGGTTRQLMSGWKIVSTTSAQTFSASGGTAAVGARHAGVINTYVGT